MLIDLYTVLVLLGRPTPTSPTTAGCVPDDRITAAFISNTIFNMARRPAGAWHHLVFAPEDTLHVVSIHDDSLCDLAMRTLRSWLVDSTYHPRGIRLLKAGNYYVAEALANPGGSGEFQPHYFLDTSLTKVFFPCRNGQACEP